MRRALSDRDTPGYNRGILGLLCRCIITLFCCMWTTCSLHECIRDPFNILKRLDGDLLELVCWSEVMPMSLAVAEKYIGDIGVALGRQLLDLRVRTHVLDGGET
jgi:hypothetical protein